MLCCHNYIHADKTAATISAKFRIAKELDFTSELRVWQDPHSCILVVKSLFWKLQTNKMSLNARHLTTSVMRRLFLHWLKSKLEGPICGRWNEHSHVLTHAWCLIMNASLNRKVTGCKLCGQHRGLKSDSTEAAVLSRHFYTSLIFTKFNACISNNVAPPKGQSWRCVHGGTMCKVCLNKFPSIVL